MRRSSVVEVALLVEYTRSHHTGWTVFHLAAVQHKGPHHTLLTGVRFAVRHKAVLQLLDRTMASFVAQELWGGCSTNRAISNPWWKKGATI